MGIAAAEFFSSDGTMKAMNFQDEILSTPIDNFKRYYVLDFIWLHRELLLKWVITKNQLEDHWDWNSTLQSF